GPRRERCDRPVPAPRRSARQGCHRRGCGPPRRLIALVSAGGKAMEFAPGQSIVWMYQPRAPAQLRILVDGEVVQSGSLRNRIRVWNTQGIPLMRWVKPEKL